MTTAFTAFIEAAIKEDLGPIGDITSAAVLSESASTSAVAIAKEAGVFAGQAFLPEILQTVSTYLVLDHCSPDGSTLKAGDQAVRFHGPTRAVLTAERTVLNAIGMASGIATRVRTYVDIVAPYGAKILDTRKTLPGLRALSKYAVTVGGGLNHRIGLYDQVLIKDNHIAAVGSLTAAVQAVRKAYGDRYLVIAEARTRAEVLEATNLPIDRLLLDNFSPEQLPELIALLPRAMRTEISGGLNLDTVAAYAKAGVDYLSIGDLTKNVHTFDFSLDLL